MIVTQIVKLESAAVSLSKHDLTGTEISLQIRMDRIDIVPLRLPVLYLRAAIQLMTYTAGWLCTREPNDNLFDDKYFTRQTVVWLRLILNCVTGFFDIDDLP